MALLQGICDGTEVSSESAKEPLDVSNAAMRRLYIRMSDSALSFNIFLSDAVRSLEESEIDIKDLNPSTANKRDVSPLHTAPASRAM